MHGDWRVSSTQISGTNLRCSVDWPDRPADSAECETLRRLPKATDVAATGTPIWKAPRRRKTIFVRTAEYPIAESCWGQQPRPGFSCEKGSPCPEFRRRVHTPRKLTPTLSCLNHSGIEQTMLRPDRADDGSHASPQNLRSPIFPIRRAATTRAKITRICTTP